MSNAKHCLLAATCTLADGAACTRQCASYVAMHGMTGTGGRAGAGGLPASYRLVTLANSPARADQAKAYAIFDQYAATFGAQFAGADGPRIKSMYLYSVSPGTGKTTSAAALLNAWLVAHYVGSLKRGQQPAQQPAYFLDVAAWQELYTGFTRPHIPADIAEASSRQYYRQLEHAKHAPFAVLDDIGVRSATEGFRGDLHTVINHRTTADLPTVYTSNLPLLSPTPQADRVAAQRPYDLLDVFGEARLVDRMRDQCAVVHFEGKSKRGRR